MRNRILRFVTYAAVGVGTGLIVAGVVVLAEKVLLEAVLHRSLLQQACAPALGLWIAVLVLRRADAGNPLSPSTSAVPSVRARYFHVRHRLPGRIPAE